MSSSYILSALIYFELLGFGTISLSYYMISHACVISQSILIFDNKAKQNKIMKYCILSPHHSISIFKHEVLSIFPLTYGAVFSLKVEVRSACHPHVIDHNNFFRKAQKYVQQYNPSNAHTHHRETADYRPLLQ